MRGSIATINALSVAREEWSPSIKITGPMQKVRTAIAKMPMDCLLVGLGHLFRSFRTDNIKTPAVMKAVVYRHQALWVGVK